MSGFLGALSAGWHQYADAGMYMGIFFAALLFIWLVRSEGFKKERNEVALRGQRLLFLYALGITVLVFCPLSACVLLKYQTAFFTYSQLFLLLPMLPVIAWAMTELVVWMRANFHAEKDAPQFVKSRPWTCELAAMLILGAVLYLGGNLAFAHVPTKEIDGGATATTLGEATNAEKIPQQVLQVLQAMQSDADIDLDKEIIVAPDEVLEYARAYSADFKLLYGRNMWRPELNAYTYDTYSADLQEFHQWLNSTVHGLFAVETDITAEQAVEILVTNGCTVFVLTRVQYAEEEIVEAFGEQGFRIVAETPEYGILKR